jgi:hypothetical protein
MVKADPTLGIDNPPHRHGDGSPPWTEEHVVVNWHAPTRLARRAAVHWTPSRRCCSLRPPTRQGRHRYDKNRKERFHAHRDDSHPAYLGRDTYCWPCGDLTFIAGESGRPLKKNPLAIYSVMPAVRPVSPALRTVSARLRLPPQRNNGATVAQLDALFGWTGGAMASLYTRSANRRRLSLDAASKWGPARRAKREPFANFAREFYCDRPRLRARRRP